MTRSRVALGLTLSWIGLWGCQGESSGGSSIADFIEYYSDSSMWCEHQASCGQTMLAVCQDNWPSMKDTETALKYAELTREELAKCRTSSVAYDDCYLSASCEEIAIAGATDACEAEFERFSLDCEGLLEGFTMVRIGAEPGGEGDGDGDHSSMSLAIGEEICDRSTECSGEPSAEERADCIDSVASAFETMPDPQGVLACLQGMSCESIENDGTSQCLSIDPDATMCLDADTLNLCNMNGVCSDQNCSFFCESLGFTSIGCAFSEAEGYDQCQCGA